MSRSKNKGKRLRDLKLKPASKNEYILIWQKHSWGRTERFRRRHKDLWSRLVNKERRSLDKEEIEKSLQEE